MSDTVDKVLVTSSLSQRKKDLVTRARQEGLGHVVFVFPDSREQSLTEITDADVALVGPWDAELLAAAKHLRWVHKDTGGVELFPEFVDSPIQFTSIKPVFGTAGAETALLGILLFSRRAHHLAYIKPGPDRFESHDHVLKPDEISGKTVGIVGMGYMGEALAKRAKGLGLRVLATARRHHEAPPSVDLMLTLQDLPILLQQSDYVVVSVPSTPMTAGMVNENFLKYMKESAFLIDLSGRTAIYNWQDLVESIEKHSIAGVCLQPSGHDPQLGMPPVNSAFWDHENVVVTPCRVTSSEMGQQGMDLVIGNLLRLENGEVLLGLIDKQAGY